MHSTLNWSLVSENHLVCNDNWYQMIYDISYQRVLVAVNLSTDTVNKLRIYQENFEQVYISSAVDFYTAQASAYLSENGIQNYMKYVCKKCIHQYL